MKAIRLLLLLCSSVLPAVGLVIPSDGSDGAFNPTVDIEIDLSQAVTGTWSDDNTANAGQGIYDPDKWAVVFKFSSINIPVDVTVTFKNHPTRAPVIWLVQGTAVIDGKVDLNGSPGKSGIEALVPPESGPGGFRGGPSGPDGSGFGLGPGGSAGAGWHGYYRSAYGNPQILPLIGGSGGGTGGLSGGAGGGAILIGVSGSMTVNGSIESNGGRDVPFVGGQVGSGGAIRVLAEALLGGGTLAAKNGDGSSSGGSEGRIRVETNSFSTSIDTFPETVAVPPASPPLIFAPPNAPNVRIASVDGLGAPPDPTAPLQANADVTIQNNAPVTITLGTTNFPIEGVVQLRIAPKFGSATLLNCTYQSGDLTSATWTVTTTLLDGFSTLQARATAP